MDFGFDTVSQEIPDSMPMLDEWLTGHCPGQPLSGVTALFIQHQFGNQVPQTKALLKLGLDPKRLIWLDVPYTSNPTVRKALVATGIPSDNFIVADDYKVLAPYAPYQRLRVQKLVLTLLEQRPERLLVLDDGAYFIEAASCFSRRMPGVAIVEQTTRGVIKFRASAAIRAYSRKVPIVNVAESAPKKTLEPPFIARAICSALSRKLACHTKGRNLTRCLVLGYGAIGAQVARFASTALGINPTHVYVFDRDRTRNKDAASAGFSIWNPAEFDTRFSIVVGCTGEASFGVHDYVYLDDGAILASASSGSVELSREGFVELADSSDIDDIEVVRHGLDESDVHSDIEFRVVDRSATLLNAGFPVNFEGQVNCVPTRYMQPTATMMVAASVQAINSNARGLVELDSRFCRWLDDAFKKQLGNEAMQIYGARGDSSCAAAS